MLAGAMQTSARIAAHEWRMNMHENKCSVCGSNEHEWTAHMNQITKDTGFGLWERAEDGFICGYCNKISKS